jgi:hypothetical protein
MRPPASQVKVMPSFLENIEKLNLPKVSPPTIPDPVLEVASRLGLTLTLTSPSVPEQYEVLRDGAPSGYIRARHCGMQVTYPDAGDEDLYDGAVDGFGGFTDHEREAKLLFAMGLIAARMMAG